jgi:hypothetical protein
VESTGFIADKSLESETCYSTASHAESTGFITDKSLGRNPTGEFVLVFTTSCVNQYPTGELPHSSDNPFVHEPQFRDMPALPTTCFGVVFATSFYDGPTCSVLYPPISTTLGSIPVYKPPGGRHPSEFFTQRPILPGPMITTRRLAHAILVCSTSLSQDHCLPITASFDALIGGMWCCCWLCRLELLQRSDPNDLGKLLIVMLVPLTELLLAELLSVVLSLALPLGPNDLGTC